MVSNQNVKKMIQLIEVLLHVKDKTPKVSPSKLLVNPEDISHLHRNEHNESFIFFRNGKAYQLFDGIDEVKKKLQLN